MTDVGTIEAKSEAATDSFIAWFEGQEGKPLPPLVKNLAVMCFKAGFVTGMLEGADGLLVIATGKAASE